MGNFFPKRSNWAPLKLAICLVATGAAVTGGIWYYFTPKYTRVGFMPVQPVPFSHAVHAQQLGMDCRYCHGSVEISGHANIPTTQACMACHVQIKPTSPKLEAVRESWKSGRPVRWARVHRLPDYVYFNHAAHVNRGAGCYSCHGAVNEMQVVWQAEPQSMSWCLDCHRTPENFLRPQSEVFNMTWQPPAGETQCKIGQKLKGEWDVNPPVNCGACHR